LAFIVVKNNPPLLPVIRKFIHCSPLEVKFSFQPIDEADDIGVKRICLPYKAQFRIGVWLVFEEQPLPLLGDMLKTSVQYQDFRFVGISIMNLCDATGRDMDPFIQPDLIQDDRFRVGFDHEK